MVKSRRRHVGRRSVRKLPGEFRPYVRQGRPPRKEDEGQQVTLERRYTGARGLERRDSRSALDPV